MASFDFPQLWCFYEHFNEPGKSAGVAITSVVTGDDVLTSSPPGCATSVSEGAVYCGLREFRDGAIMKGIPIVRCRSMNNGKTTPDGGHGNSEQMKTNAATLMLVSLNAFLLLGCGEKPSVSHQIAPSISEAGHSDTPTGSNTIKRRPENTNLELPSILPFDPTEIQRSDDMDAISRVVGDSARVDFEKTAATILDLPAGNKRVSLLAFLAQLASPHQLKSLMLRVLSSGYEEDRAIINSVLAGDSRLKSRDLYELNLAAKDELSKSVFLSKLAGCLLDKQPLDIAVASANEFPDASSGTHNLAETILFIASRTKPALVLEYLNAGNNVSDHAINDIVRNWGHEHPNTTKQWIAQLAETKNKPELVATFVGGWLLLDAEQASEYALNVEGDENKKQAALAVYSYLKDKGDDEATRAWYKIASDHLPFEQVPNK